jgi:hypothetical protein
MTKFRIIEDTFHLNLDDEDLDDNLGDDISDVEWDSSNKTDCGELEDEENMDDEIQELNFEH